MVDTAGTFSLPIVDDLLIRAFSDCFLLARTLVFDDSLSSDITSNFLVLLTTIVVLEDFFEASFSLTFNEESFSLTFNEESFSLTFNDV